jgi:hypothetical protein
MPARFLLTHVHVTFLCLVRGRRYESSARTEGEGQLSCTVSPRSMQVVQMEFLRASQRYMYIERGKHDSERKYNKIPRVRSRV